MGLLILDKRGMALRQNGEAATLYDAGQHSGSIPLKLVDQLIVHGGDIALDSGVLGRLGENGGLGVIFSGRHSRRVAVIMGPGHNDIWARLGQARAVTDVAQIDAWAHRLVIAKLRHHARFLRRALALRPDARRPLLVGLQHLEGELSRLQAPGPANPPWAAARLRGVEGAAAAAYFKAFGALFAPSLGFEGRNRRPPLDPVNACLSLAYTLLHAQAIQACHSQGLDPLMGLYHRPAHGRASLAADLIEPLRALADEWVWQQFRERSLRPEHFWQDGPACLLGKAGREHFYPAFTPLRALAQRWLRQQCRALVNTWRNQGEAALPEAEFTTEDDTE